MYGSGSEKRMSLNAAANCVAMPLGTALDVQPDPVPVPSLIRAIDVPVIDEQASKPCTLIVTRLGSWRCTSVLVT
jgi:hypothetical protein